MDYFYKDVFDTKALISALEDIIEDEKHRLELRELYYSALHHAIIDHVLSNLPENHHPIVITLIEDAKHDDVWILLREHIEEPETSIRTIATDMTKDWMNDVLLLKLEKYS